MTADEDARPVDAEEAAAVAAIDTFFAALDALQWDFRNPDLQKLARRAWNHVDQALQAAARPTTPPAIPAPRSAES